jgi:outer membrane lipoprotein LolB
MPRLGFVLAAVVLAGSILAGCSVPKREAAPTSEIGAPPQEVKALRLSGRIALRQGKEAHNGNVRWLHDAPHHEIAVLTPLGTTVATIVQDVGKVKLTTSDKETYEAVDAEGLMENVLGWRLPLNGMQYWVLGRAAPPEADAQREVGADNRLARLTQQDWRIEYSNYRPVGNTEFPSRITMRRDDIEIKLVVDSFVAVDSTH